MRSYDPYVGRGVAAPIPHRRGVAVCRALKWGARHVWRGRAHMSKVQGRRAGESRRGARGITGQGQAVREQPRVVCVSSIPRSGLDRAGVRRGWWCSGRVVVVVVVVEFVGCCRVCRLLL